MKTYIPEFKIGEQVWFNNSNRIYISKIDFIIMDFDGNFKYHLTGLVGEYKEESLNRGWPVM